MERNVRLKVEKSEFPDEEGTHLVVMYSFTEHGLATKRLFKGSQKECLEKKKELEGNNEPKRKNSRIFRKKSNNNNTRKCNAIGNN